MQREPMRELRVSNWAEFNAWNASRDGWAFRGEHDASWPLVSSLARRLAQMRVPRTLWREREERALRVFRRKAHVYLPDRTVLEDTLRCLAMMQHHGAPTRLLDFTKSPYVAAFFALENALADSAVSHTGNPFAGVSAAFLAAQFVHTIDYNPEYGDALNGVAAPPPVSLRLRDGKQAYDVTTPQTAWCAVNLLSHARSPTQVVNDVKRAAQHALNEALATMSQRAQRVGVPSLAWQPCVLTYAELRERALANANESSRQRFLQLESTATRDGDPFDWLRRDGQVVEAAWALSGLAGPAAVVCLAAPFYPLVMLDEHDAKGAQLMQAITRQSSIISHEANQSIQFRPLFIGVSDMSFFAKPINEFERAMLLSNAPTRATQDHIAGSIASAIDAPIVNIGPWGRDYHQRTERLYMPYAFDVLPELVWRVVGATLRESRP